MARSNGKLQRERPEPIRAKTVLSTEDETGLRYKVVVRFPPDMQRPIQSFYFEIRGEPVPPPVDRQDFVVLALIFCAMRNGRDLFVEGRVSQELLINLEEFQRAWALWRPGLYQPVRVACSEEIAAAPEFRRRAVVALSGGVDGCFAMLSQIANKQSRDRCELEAAMLIHGFDISLDSVDAFDVARANAEATAAVAELPLMVVRTDWRTRISTEWADEFGAGVAAALCLFSPIADIGLLGSDEDYAHLAFPWGSNAITNPFLSSDVFRIITVGSGFGRTAKVASIARHGGLAEHLRVCWQGPQTGRNCGQCEKCVRTKLNFLVAGAEVPASLGAPPSTIEILRLSAPNPVSIAYLVDIRDTARRSGLPPELRLAIEACVVKNRLLLPIRGWRKVLRRFFRWVVPKRMSSD